MKLLFTNLLLLVFCSKLFSQGYTEFRTNDNGLMYGEPAMKKLKEMVVKENLKYKSCGLEKPFLSCPQGRVFSVSFESKRNNLKRIIEDIKTDMGFYNVVSSYKSLVKEIDTTDLCIDMGADKDGKKYYLKGGFDAGYEEDYILSGAEKEEVSGRWVFDYDIPDKHSKEYTLEARFFPSELVQQSLSIDYSRLIQYVDCMIDTNATVYLTEKYSGGFWSQNDKEDFSRLRAYIVKKAAEKGLFFNEDTYNFSDSLNSFAAKNLAGDSNLVWLLKDEIAAAVKAGKGNASLESLAQMLGLEKEHLQLMRYRRVMGTCSQDQSPRLHALAIATAAGEVQQWDIFMRAHMDIMNDRFSRMSDGSYAWNQRQTYLKELEELDLNVTDMMLGMAMRAANTADNHYNGTVWRLGKAMAESKDRKAFEQRAMGMIADTTLDDFNRGLIYLMFNSYIRSLKDIGEANQLIESLRTNESLLQDDRLKMAISQLKDIKRDEDKE